MTQTNQTQGESRAIRRAWMIFLALAIIAVFFVTAAPALGQTVIYVDQNAKEPPFDGSSWCQAYLSLSDALEAVDTDVPTTIRIADGVYKPSTDDLENPRKASFTVFEGTTIEGGYAGCGAADPDARYIAKYETVLSGDIGEEGIVEDNCLNVVRSKNFVGQCVLDGVTIRSGNHDGLSSYGGGLCIGENQSVLLRHCTFIDNRARYGGAVGGLLAQEIDVESCNFVLNKAVGQKGGAIVCLHTDTLSITDSSFEYNTADVAGGAIFASDECDFQIVGSTFTNNISQENGGAVACDDGSTLTIENSNFEENTAVLGGGGVYATESVTLLTNSTFDGNVSVMWFGGGMFSEFGQAVVTDCEFIGNESVHPDFGYGGGLVMRKSNAAVVEDCHFLQNASRFGGGLFLSDVMSGRVSYCTFDLNTATHGAGGIGIEHLCCAPEDTAVTVSKCDFAGNTANEGGGAMGLYLTNATVRECVFEDNIAGEEGGAANTYNHGQSTFVGCHFKNNAAGIDGGAIAMDYYSEGDIIGCAFRANEATDSAGAVYLDFMSKVDIINSTFAFNSAGGQGGAYYATDLSPATITNCVVWDNLPDGIDSSSSSLPYVTFSCLQVEPLQGSANIIADPLFVSETDLRLQSGSPCIDRGWNDALPAGIETDLAGLPRFVDDPDTPNQLPDPPTVDLGAYEFQGASNGEPADVNDDGVVDVLDLLAVLAAWGECAACPEDITGDGMVDVLDLLAVLAAWG